MLTHLIRALLNRRPPPRPELRVFVYVATRGRWQMIARGSDHNRTLPDRPPRAEDLFAVTFGDQAIQTVYL